MALLQGMPLLVVLDYSDDQYLALEISDSVVGMNGITTLADLHVRMWILLVETSILFVIY